MTDKIDKETQEMYVQLQMMDQQLQQIQQELSSIEAKKQEFSLLKESLGEFSKLKKGVKSMAQIGPQIFSEVQLENVKNLLVNVGANIYVKKDVNNVLKIVNDQLTKLSEIENQLMQSAQMMSIQSQVVQAQLQKQLGIGQ